MRATRCSSRRVSENQLDATADVYVAMMGALLIERGAELKNKSSVDAGIELVRFFVSHSAWIDGALVEKWMRYMWSESMMHAFALYALARHTGDRAHRKAADATVRKVGRADPGFERPVASLGGQQRKQGGLLEPGEPVAPAMDDARLFFVEPEARERRLHAAIDRQEP